MKSTIFGITYLDGDIQRSVYASSPGEEIVLLLNKGSCKTGINSAVSYLERNGIPHYTWSHDFTIPDAPYFLKIYLEEETGRIRLGLGFGNTDVPKLGVQSRHRHFDSLQLTLRYALNWLRHNRIPLEGTKVLCYKDSSQPCGKPLSLTEVLLQQGAPVKNQWKG